MMRCVRFATQLNFQIEEETYDALSRNAERLKIISAERICDEMNKIMLQAPKQRFLLPERYRSARSHSARTGCDGQGGNP